MTNFAIVNTRKYRDDLDDRLIAEEEERINPKSNDNDDQDDVIPESKEEQTWKKRYADLRAFEAKKEREAAERLATLERELDEKNSQLRNVVKTNQNLPQSADRDTVFQWIRDYPDVYSVLRAIVNDEIEDSHEKKTKHLVTEVESLKQQRQVENAQAQYNRLLKAHEDFPALVESEDFKSWLAMHEERGFNGNRVSKAIYDALVNDNDADAAIDAVNQYKAQAKPRRQRTQVDDQAEAASNVRSSRREAPATHDSKGRTWKESDIDRMTAREYEKYGDEIEEARIEGRIVYDITGAAR